MPTVSQARITITCGDVSDSDIGLTVAVLLSCRTLQSRQLWRTYASSSAAVSPSRALEASVSTVGTEEGRATVESERREAPASVESWEDGNETRVRLSKVV